MVWVEFSSSLLCLRFLRFGDVLVVLSWKCCIRRSSFSSIVVLVLDCNCCDIWAFRLAISCWNAAFISEISAAYSWRTVCKADISDAYSFRTVCIIVCRLGWEVLDGVRESFVSRLLGAVEFGFTLLRVGNWLDSVVKSIVDGIGRLHALLDVLVASRESIELVEMMLWMVLAYLD